MEIPAKEQLLFMTSVAELAKQRAISPADALVIFGRMAALLAENEAIGRGITLDAAKQHATALFAQGLALPPSARMAQSHKPSKFRH